MRVRVTLARLVCAYVWGCVQPRNTEETPGGVQEQAWRRVGRSLASVRVTNPPPPAATPSEEQGGYPPTKLQPMFVSYERNITDTLAAIKANANYM